MGDSLQRQKSGWDTKGTFYNVLSFSLDYQSVLIMYLLMHSASQLFSFQWY